MHFAMDRAFNESGGSDDQEKEKEGKRNEGDIGE